MSAAAGYTIERYWDTPTNHIYISNMTLTKESAVNLYEVCIILVPTEDAKKAGAVNQILVGPTTVVAKGEREAIAGVAAKNPKDIDASRIEVVVRPFKAA